MKTQNYEHLTTEGILSLPGASEAIKVLTAFGDTTLADLEQTPEALALAVIKSVIMEVDALGTLMLASHAQGLTIEQREAWIQDEKPWTSPVLRDSLTREKTKTQLLTKLFAEAKDYLKEPASSRNRYQNTVLDLANYGIRTVQWFAYYSEGQAVHDGITRMQRADLVSDLSRTDRETKNSKPSRPNFAQTINQFAESDATRIIDTYGNDPAQWLTMLQSRYIPEGDFNVMQKILTDWLSSENYQSLHVRLHEKLILALGRYGLDVDTAFQISNPKTPYQRIYEEPEIYLREVTTSARQRMLTTLEEVFPGSEGSDSWIGYRQRGIASLGEPDPSQSDEISHTAAIEYFLRRIRQILPQIQLSKLPVIIGDPIYGDPSTSWHLNWYTDREQDGAIFEESLAVVNPLHIYTNLGVLAHEWAHAVHHVISNNSNLIPKQREFFAVLLQHGENNISGEIWKSLMIDQTSEEYVNYIYMRSSTTNRVNSVIYPIWQHIQAVGNYLGWKSIEQRINDSNDGVLTEDDVSAIVNEIRERTHQHIATAYEGKVTIPHAGAAMMVNFLAAAAAYLQEETAEEISPSVVMDKRFGVNWFFNDEALTIYFACMTFLNEVKDFPDWEERLINYLQNTTYDQAKHSLASAGLIIN